MIQAKWNSMCESPRKLRTASLHGWVVTLVAAWSSVAGAFADDVPAGQWLFDHAAAFSMNLGEPTAADAEYVLIWLDAAIDVSPDLAQAHRQRADLLIALDRPQEAIESLGVYCRLVPDDLNAAILHADLELEGAQTAEDRIAACEAMLKEKGSAPAAFLSDIHRRLADLLAARGDKGKARSHVQKAIEKYPGNVVARALLVQLEGKLKDPAKQIELLAAEVATNPGAALGMLNLARVLEAYGASEESSEWYGMVAGLLDRAGDDQAARQVRIEDASRHFDNGHYEACFEGVSHLLAADPADAVVEMLLIRSARALGHKGIAEQHTTSLAARLRERAAAAIDKDDYEAMIRMGEFHLDVEGDAQAALEVAKRAALYVPDFAQPLVGWSLVETGSFKDAVLPLKPLAAADQRSALMLARAQIALDDLEGAKQTLRAGEKLHFAGTNYEAIVELLKEMKEVPAPRPDLAAIRRALGHIDKRVLAFAARASEYVQFDATLDATSYAMGTPIFAKLSIENKAPFAIQLGADRMVDGMVSLWLADTARQGVRLRNYLEVQLDKTATLGPGQRIEHTQRIDSAVARMVLNHQPQNRRVFEVTFTLDPNRFSEKAASNLAGVAPVVRRFTRVPVDASAKGLKRLADKLANGNERERMTVIDVALALIHERLEALGKVPHTYAAATVDPRAIEGLILRGLKDTAPAVRARALWALAYVELDDTAIGAAAALIQDPHWLPRLLAIETFSKQQGPVFMPVLKAKSDDDSALVARLATLYIDQLSSASGPPQPHLP